MTEVGARPSRMVDVYGEGYWERGEGSNYVAYADDPGWAPTARVLDRVQPIDGRRLLEVGCAKGYFVRAALRHGFDARGIDLSEWAVRHALADVTSRVEVANAALIPFPDGVFDVVCSWEVLEHVPYAEVHEVLAEMIRVLAPGGLLVHRVCLAGHDAHEDGDDTHVLIADRGWWEALFRDAGLEPRPQIEAMLDAEFPGRDWHGRFFAWRAPLTSA